MNDSASAGGVRASDRLARYCARGHVPHALAIEGERGVGRTAFARRVAGCILCTGEDRPCGTCAHCRKIEADAHPDVTVIAPDKEGGTLSVDKVRLLRGGLSISGNDSDDRVWIVRDADRMTPPAQNALLKSLEEPPAGVHIVLICESADLLLPTIRSRLVVLRLTPPTVDECAAQLAQQLSIPADRARDAALRFGGNPGRARAWITSDDAQAHEQLACDVLALAQAGDAYGLLRLMHGRDKDRHTLQTLFSRVLERIAQDGVASPHVIHAAREAIRALQHNAHTGLLVTQFCMTAAPM